MSNLLRAKNKILGLDLGTKRIGIAITDESQTVVFPRETLEYRKFTQAVEILREMCIKENIGLIVVGLPLDENNEKRKITLWIEKKTQQLQNAIRLPVEFVDEFFSTQEGIAKMPKYQKEHRDSMAAMIILERYLLQTR